jgi:hypothetical protein
LPSQQLQLPSSVHHHLLEIWQDEDKKWLLQAMHYQKMFLKSIVKKHIKNESLRTTIIRALKISPHKKDNKYAERLLKKYRK